MDRVLAIIGLRLRLLARQMRGKGGTLNLLSAIVLLLVGVLFALGLAVGFGIMIHMLVKGSDPRTLRIGFLVCFYTFLFFGIVLPVVRGAMEQEFDAAPFLVFPISRVRLFGLTLAATLGGPDHLLYIPSVLAVLIAGVFVPGVQIVAGTALVLLAFLFYVSWNNLLSLLLVSMMRGRRAREIVTFLAIGLLLTISLAPVALDKSSESIRDSIPQLAATLEIVMSLIQWLPPSLAAEGLASLHEAGASGKAFSGILGLLVWDAIGIALGYYVFSRYYLGEPRIRVASRRKIRSGPGGSGLLGGWLSFDRGPLSTLPVQVRAVAAKDLQYMLRSVVGRLQLFVVPIFVVIVALVFRESIEESLLGIDPEQLLLFGMLFYALLMSNNFVNNAFAWEGEGIKSYFMSPVSLRTVLYGKNVAVWLYNVLLFSLILVSWSAVMGPPDLATFFSAIFLYVAAILIFMSFGNFLSVLFPVRREMSKMNNSPSPLVVLASFMTLGTAMAVILPFLSIPLLLGWNAAQPVLLALLAGVMVGVYSFSLGHASRLMANRRDRIVDALKSVI